MSVIPIYKAIQFIDIIPSEVGHTQPWVVAVMTPEGLLSYVVKLYTPDQVEIQHCVTKEVIGNALANEFDLKVPQMALIDLSLLESSLPFELLQQYDASDQRLKFATRALEGVTSALVGSDKKIYEQRIDMGVLYGFDNLIRNQDRGGPKTNLLLNDKDAFLIDHELCFMEKDIVGIDIAQMNIEARFSNTHIFYQYLQSKRNKDQIFDDFAYYLSELRVSKLNPYFFDLSQNGFIDFSGLIIGWLNNVQSKSSIFVEFLKRSLYE